MEHREALATYVPNRHGLAYGQRMGRTDAEDQTLLVDEQRLELPALVLLDSGEHRSKPRGTPNVGAAVSHRSSA